MKKIKRPKIGEYVLATQFSDKDPNDPWCVSTVTHILEDEDSIACRVLSGGNRYYRHFWRITKQEGDEWLKNFHKELK